MNNIKIVSLLILFFLFAGVMFSEKIILTDGQVVEGYMLSMDEQTIKIKMNDGNVVAINRDQIVSIDYQKETSVNTNAIQLTQQPLQSAQMPVVAPIEAYPPVSYPIDPYSVSGLLDPELEARNRIVKFNERKKNPMLASSLGLVFPGCGHFYSEKIGEGFFFLGSRALFGTMIWYGFKPKITDPNSDPVQTTYNDIVVGSVGAVGFTAVTIFEVIDAYYAAEAFNDNLKLKLGIDTLHSDVVPIFGE